MKIRYIDLFAGIGGFRKGFELACEELNITSECVLTSEIKKSAIRVYKENYNNAEVKGDICSIKSEDIPDFDVLLAGFPCQSYSLAGSRKGLEDKRGQLFWEVYRVLKEKQPIGFILENVEGLILHNKNKSEEIGKTFSLMLENLKSLNYNIYWKLLDASEYGVAQARKRVYIIGVRGKELDLDTIEKENKVVLNDILEQGLLCVNTSFISMLLSNYKIEELEGKAITDKRGGSNNIHSWNIGMRGKVTEKQKEFLDKLLLERRKECNRERGIDGSAVSRGNISKFSDITDIELVDLVEKGYIKRVEIDNKICYDIKGGKMSFEVNKVLDRNGISPTLVATDMNRLYVIDGQSKGLRRLSTREGLRLFGYPEDYKIEGTEREISDLLGNTVVVPVISKIAKILIKEIEK